MSTLLDVGIIILGPLIAVPIIGWAIFLLVRGVYFGWKFGEQSEIAIPVIVAPILAVAALAVAIMPIMRLGSCSQAAGTLLLYRASYEETMTSPTPARLRDNLARSAGVGRGGIWSFGYGGFLSMERDIVFDPLDRPEARSVQMLQATSATCQPLWSHYYDCFLDY